jgi:FkbM family methyltransferase
MYDVNRLRAFNPNAFHTMIDIGVNTGSFLSAARTLFPRANIIGYEPFPKGFENSVHVKRMHYGDKQCTTPPFGKITLYNKGLGDGVPLYFNRQFRKNLRKDQSIDAHHQSPLDSVFIPLDENYNPDIDFTIETVTLKQIVEENEIDLSKDIYFKVDCECCESCLYNDESLEIMRNFRVIFIEAHFPPHDGNGVVKQYHQFSQCSNCVDYHIHNNWLRSNFSDAYDIDYYRSQKGQGHGHYLLTRKEDNISSVRGHEQFLKTR